MMMFCDARYDFFAFGKNIWTSEFLVIAIRPCHSEPLGEESEAAGLYSSKLWCAYGLSFFGWRL
jgi:hypothetical protein